MNLKQKVNEQLIEVIENLYQIEVDRLEIQNTRKEFKGEYTLVTFPLTRALKKKQEQIGEEIGQALLDQNIIDDFN